MPQQEHGPNVDHVIKLDLPWWPGGGAPGPRLRLSEQEAVLAYRVQGTDQQPDTFAILHFPGCQFAMFGRPGHNGFFE